jgi:hypothetical protein
MLQVTAHPHETFDAALHFAFALLSSEGSFAADSSDPVPLPDILELITALMRRDAAAEATALLETVRVTFLLTVTTSLLAVSSHTHTYISLAVL